MSTRSQIRIIQNHTPVTFYHHHDGYFSGVGRELQSVLRTTTSQLWDCSQDAAAFIQELQKNYNGYEVCFYPHDDIEYFYLLDFDCRKFVGYRVSAFSGWGGDGDDTWKNGKGMPMPCKTDYGHPRVFIDLMKDEIEEDE